MPKTQKDTGTIQIQSLKVSGIKFFIKGTSPLVYNAMSFKARCELLSPRGRLSAVEKATKLKHDPISEFRDSVYAHAGEHATRLYFPAGGFKRGMTTAALELPGVSKSSLNRLLWVEPRNVDIYGTPQLMMAPTRSSDMNHTPDIRTRAVLPQWCASIEIKYAEPRLSADPCASLLSASGQLCGIGDWRVEKGGSFGQFQIVNHDDEELLQILEHQGQHAQDAALEEPQPFDLESEKLLKWYYEDLNRRTATRPYSRSTNHVPAE